MDTEDSMAVKTGIKSQGDICCLRDLSGRGDELLHLNGVLAVAAGRAEGFHSTRPAGETTPHTDSCCLHRETPGSGHSLADGQVCKNTGLGCSLSRNSLLSQQADTPKGKDDSSGSAAVLEIDTEKLPGVTDDSSDDDLEYFECSDVLTVQENEIWQKKLQFLLESDDGDDLKLSEDCDGCARLLGEAPCAPPVSGDTAPVETPIGFRGHHSKLPGLGVRGDPSMSSQSPVQADMTLAVGPRRQRSSSGPKDGGSAPVAPAAAAGGHPWSQEGADASGHLADEAGHADPDAAAAGAEPRAGGAGAAGTMTGAGVAPGESSPPPGEGGRDVPEESTQHTGCAFAETLRRNLFKLLNPLELCRYVSTIGQSLQAAAEGRESTAPSASQESVLIPKETESLEVQAEEADKDCPWERRRTQGPPEQNQMPDENVPLGDRGAHLKSVAQNCENLRVEPEKEGTLRAWESGGSSQPAAGMLSADITLPAEDADLQTPSGERESCHPEASSGQEIINNGNKSKEEISAFPSGGAGSVPDEQECLCAVLSPAKPWDEPGEGERSSGFERWDSIDRRGSIDRQDSIDTDLPCSPSGGADPQPALESACRGDADVSAVHDKLWKLLHEDDSECQVPSAGRAVASLETRPRGIQAPEMDVVQGACCHPPVPVDGVEEQEPLPAASPGQAEDSDPPLRGAASPTARLARAVRAGGAGNEGEAPAVCPSATSTLIMPGLRPEHWVNGSLPHFGGGLAHCPEEKGIFPRDNTCQLTRAGHCSADTVPGSDEVNLQAEGDHSDSNTQNNTDSQSCHLSETEGCRDFQVVSAAQKHGSVMQLPALIEPPAAITPNNLPQTAERLPETAEQEGAFPPSSGDLLLRDFCLEMPSCEAAKAGEQREIHTAGEHRAGACCDPGVPQVSESQAAVSPHCTAEQQGRGDHSDAQQLPGRVRLLTPAGHSEGLLPSSAACQVKKNGSTPAGGEGNRNLSVLGTFRASQGLFQRAPAETQGEGDEQERPRAAECSPDEAEAKAALQTLMSCQAQGQVVNTGTEQSCPDGIPSTQADHSIKSTEQDKEGELRAAESVVNCGLVNLPPADSGSKGCSEEQTPCGRARPLPVASTTCNPLPVSVERQRNQEGSKSCQAEPEPPRCKQDAAKGGHSAAGAKKKLPPAALSKKPRLEEKGGVKKSGKGEAGATRREDKKPEQRKLGLKKDSKAPRLLKKIQAESFPEGSGNVRLCCQFGDVHGDSTVTWTKDSKVLARLHRSAQDDSPVSLEIAKAGTKDQGMYYCCLSNTYGKVTAEFHLTAAVLERLSSFRSYEGVEEIEFMQLLFREDSISDSYFGGQLRGVLATEQLHFGEGMHRRAFRSRVRRGLAPVFAPGHACVLKVHSALSPASGTRDELVRRNYNLALQECRVQNAAREYAKLYAAEAETLEGFGEVPEIIPVFLIHRPANSIPYATVEEELVGEFVKYSVRDGKEVNFLRRDSEAGQKCCTFQHWVYERTSGNLLVTDLQGVGMKLTDVGIATLAKGYKGFKGNCSFSFIEQFRALHQCNQYCQMLGLKALRAPHQKQRKATAPKGKSLPSPSAAKKTGPKKGREHRDFISSEH